MRRKRTSSAPELLISLDRTASEPVVRQLEHELRSAVREGRLRAGSALPSSRAMARELGVSRGLVVGAYEQLVAEGYLASRPGGTTRVARRPKHVGGRRDATDALAFDYDFRPGRPDLTSFPREAWLRSIRRSLAAAPAARLGYLDGRGLPELRVALAEYLNRVRGTAAAPDDVVVTVGFAQGLTLIGSVLRTDGVRRFAIETPSLADSKALLEATGLQVVEIPVDEDGLRVDLLDRARVGAVLITPAHQYPTGVVLSPERRLALLAWADRRGGLIVEDDYDAEFRYDRQPIGAMQGLRPDRIVYAGTASKVLAPGLRLGWCIGPPAFADRMAALKKARDQGSPAIDQLAFADFIAQGELDRHLRRMRPIYRHRRDLVIAAMARHLPELQPVGAAAGLHVMAWLPETADAPALAAAAADRSIGVAAVPAPPALVLGYGAVDESRIEPGIRRLAGVLATASAVAGAAPTAAASAEPDQHPAAWPSAALPSPAPVTPS